MFDFLKDQDSVSKSILTFFSDLMVEMMRNESILEKKLREESIIMSEYVLLNLISKEDDLTINLLAENVNVTSSTMVIRLNHLEEKGLIERVRSNEDRRKVYVLPSDNGKRIIEEIGEFHPETVILEKIQILSEAEKDHFEQILNKINQHSNVTKEERFKLFKFMLNKRLFETNHSWES